MIGGRAPRTSLPRRVWGLLRSSLWPLPVLGIIVAVGLGIALPAVDGTLQGRAGEEPLKFVFGGGPSAARDLLAAIAGSLISVTGLTFSFTVVALQLASSQHSPRFLQTFVTDRVVQATLAQLVGTFVYALTVLRTVRSEDSTADETAFVPRLSVTVGFVSAVVSVVALVLFLGHLAQSLRVETMLRDVSAEARDAYARLLPADQDPDCPQPIDQPRGAPRLVFAQSSGFVVGVDAHPIVQAAHEADVTVRLVPRVGDSLVAGTPMAHVWPRSVAAGAAVDLGNVDRSLQRNVQLDFERAPSRDIGYSLRKVVDIAVRALSPGTNDPTTAAHAMSHVSALLGELLERPPGPLQFRDDDGVLRLIVLQWDAAALIQLGLEEPLAFASGQPAVLRRIAKLLQELVWRTPRGPADAILRAHLTQAMNLAADSTSVSRTEIESWQRRFDDALTGRWEAEV